MNIIIAHISRYIHIVVIHFSLVNENSQNYGNNKFSISWNVFRINKIQYP